MALDILCVFAVVAAFTISPWLVVIPAAVVLAGFLS